jgi:hypothetical protein
MRHSQTPNGIIRRVAESFESSIEADAFDLRVGSPQ